MAHIAAVIHKLAGNTQKDGLCKVSYYRWKCIIGCNFIDITDGNDKVNFFFLLHAYTLEMLDTLSKLIVMIGGIHILCA